MAPVYDVVLLPPDSVDRVSVAASERLRGLGTRFTLNGRNAVPHLSLYMANVGPQDLGQTMQALSGVAERGGELPLSAQRYQSNEHGMYEVFYEKTREITRLQEDVIGAVNPLRDGIRAHDPVGRPIQQRMAAVSGELRENFEKSGYDEVGSYFNPHITLARLNEPASGSAGSNMPALSEFSGTFSKLALYRMGDNGTCVSKVGEWRLRDTAREAGAPARTRGQRRDQVDDRRPGARPSGRVDRSP